MDGALVKLDGQLLSSLEAAEILMYAHDTLMRTSIVPLEQCVKPALLLRAEKPSKENVLKKGPSVTLLNSPLITNHPYGLRISRGCET